MNKINKEKIYINYIPVYRFETDDSVCYYLFEDTEQISVMHIYKELSRVEEYKIVLDQLVYDTGFIDRYKLGIKARIENEKYKTSQYKY